MAEINFVKSIENGIKDVMVMVKLWAYATPGIAIV